MSVSFCDIRQGVVFHQMKKAAGLWPAAFIVKSEDVVVNKRDTLVP